METPPFLKDPFLIAVVLMGRGPHVFRRDTPIPAIIIRSNDRELGVFGVRHPW
jgi:hypothetical protein